jgi:hypothetical protein
MPLSIACPGCSKKLNVKDELIGKRLKCPGCGNTFTAQAAPTLLPGQRTVEPGKSHASRIHISPTLILLAILAISIAGVVLLWMFGPGKAHTQWMAMETDARDTVMDVVTRGIQCELSRIGSYNPRKAHQTPRAVEMNFFASMLVLSLPEEIGFVGTSTEGAFKGKFNTRTKSVNAEVELGGVGLTTGVVMTRGNTTIQVTGRIESGAIHVQVNGQKAELVFPPESDD